MNSNPTIYIKSRKSVISALKEWVLLYDSLPDKLYFEIAKNDIGEERITLNGELSQDHLFFLVNFLAYSEVVDSPQNVLGVAKGAIYPEIKDQEIEIFISTSDTEYDNVSVVTQNNESYLIDFADSITSSAVERKFGENRWSDHFYTETKVDVKSLRIEESSKKGKEGNQQIGITEKISSIASCIVVMLATAIGYGFLRWFVIFVLWYDVFTLEAWDMYIPAVLSIWVVITTGRRMRVHREKTGVRISGKEWIYIFLTIMTYMVIYYSGQYIVQKFSTTAHIESISEIKPSSSYYVIDNARIDSSANAFRINMEKIMARSNSRIVFNAYFVFKVEGSSNCWYAKKYTQRYKYSAFTTDEDISDYTLQFATYIFQQVRCLNFSQYNRFKRVAFSNDEIGFRRALNRIQGVERSKYNIDNAIFLEATPNEIDDKSDYYLRLMLCSFVVGTLLILILLYFSKIEIKAKEPKNEKQNGFWSNMTSLCFIPSRSNWSFSLIFYVFIGCFVLTMLFGDTQLSPLWQSGALSWETLMKWEWWRIVTYIFIPEDVISPICYIQALLISVMLFSPHKTAILFILSGALSGAITAFNLDAMFASPQGAIMGLCGGIFAVCLLHKKEWSAIFSLLIAVIFFSVLVGVMSIGVTLNIVGFIIGGLLGVLLYNLQSKQKTKRGIIKSR